MDTMNAAVVADFDHPPQYAPFPAPIPDSGQEVVDVLAVGVHPRTRSGAAGRHYTSTGTLPMVPGVDAVGRRADGTPVYFAAADDTVGTMAERAVLDPRRAIDLPGDVDPATVAATMNPAMSSWVALRSRAPITSGQRVLILGATGNAGAMAVRVARRLGAGRIVGAGRNRERLAELDTADATVALTGDEDADSASLAAAAADVDIVLDYLWGRPTELAVTALLTARDDRARALDWVQIGSVAGPTAALPSAAFRSANLRLVGSGQGSVSPAGYLAQLPSLVAEIRSGRLALTPRRVPLADVTAAWTVPDSPGERLVLVP